MVSIADFEQVNAGLKLFSKIVLFNTLGFNED